jgi:hypothetical protein
MAKNKSQMPFWANAMFYLSLFDGLQSYVNNISLFLDSQAAHIKKNEPTEFVDEDSEGEYAIAMEQYDDLFPVLLGSSFIIVLVSTFERELSTYAETVRQVGNNEIKSADLRGSFHEQFKTYLSKVAKLSFDFNSDEWNDIKGLIEVRNAIVHNAGIVDDSARGRTIKIFNQRYPTLNIKGSTVYPTIPFCNQMIQVVHTFLVNLTNAAYEHYK